MRQCATYLLKPGMVIAQPVYDDRFRMLLTQGTELSDRYIQHLLEYRLPSVFVQETDTEAIVVNDLIDIKDRKEVFEAFNLFDLLQPKTVTKESKQAIRRKSGSAFTSGWLSTMKRSADRLLDNLVENAAKLYYPSVEVCTNTEFNHAIDVAILSIMIGMRLHYSDDDLARLALAALLHDIGKKKFSEKFLKIHRTDYTQKQRNIYEMHTRLGAQMIEHDFQNLTVALSVMDHHERQDGSGFPRKLKGSGQPPYMERSTTSGTIYRHGEIIGVANYYDNLVKGRIEKKFYSPVEAVQIIIEKTPQWFNETVVEEAVSTINVFPLGSNVKVLECRRYDYTGWSGVVSGLNPADIHHPRVLLLYNNRHQRIENPRMVDFSEDPYSRLRFMSDIFYQTS